MKLPVRRRIVISLALLLAACQGARSPREPTLGSVVARPPVAHAPSQAGDSQRATTAYRAYLESAPDDPARAQALRRLGDFAMQQLEERGDHLPPARGGDYLDIARHYERVLTANPGGPDAEPILYQLARVYESAGDQAAALRALDRLLATAPVSRHADEVQFRRGEILFVMQRYPESEVAYGAVTSRGAAVSPYYDRALYMQGWTRFKQSRYESALDAFVGLLDRLLAAASPDSLETPGLSNADRELLDDTLRVTGLSLAYLDGVGTLRSLFVHGSPPHAARLYRELAELYVRQERYRDAADVYHSFMQAFPTHLLAPVFQDRAIAIYRDARFPGLLIDAKRDYVRAFDPRGGWWKGREPASQPAVTGAVQSHLDELARHDHAIAQKSKLPADYDRAITNYRVYLTLFPGDVRVAEMAFLLGEALFETRQYEPAMSTFSKSAYAHPDHAHAADAGYNAVVSARELTNSAAKQPSERDRHHEMYLAERFADRFPRDPRLPDVLVTAAEGLFARSDYAKAAELAHRVTTLVPAVAGKSLRVAWTVFAHSEFERGEYAEAETGYLKLLRLMPPGDAARGPMTDKLAAAIYRQAEQQQGQGDLRAAAETFSRVAIHAPGSSIRIQADFDHATTLLKLGNTQTAVAAFERFRTRHPAHPLARDALITLARLYAEGQNHAKAAMAYRTIAREQNDPGLQRAALREAGDLFARVGDSGSATEAYQSYLTRYAAPVEPALETAARLAQLYQKTGNLKAREAVHVRMVEMEAHAGTAGNVRTRSLAAHAAFELTDETMAAFSAIKLKEPLKQSLRRKKLGMEAALSACAQIERYRDADTTTAAAFRAAEIYREMSDSLLRSERPRGLAKLEREQYDLLLEEQAWPLQEKAVELHVANAARALQGHYGEWVRKSYQALAELHPVRYARREREEAEFDAIR